MSEKYVITNCPCYIDMPLYNHDKVCRLGDIVKPNHKELYVYCQDCTDCKLKQIVELCKKTCRMRCTNDCLGTKKHCGYGQILKLLDIQEVE